MSSNPATICVIDTETTGLHKNRQAWEVAMIRRLPGGATTETEFFVEVDLSDAELIGLNIGGFYDRHPLGRALARPGPPPPIPGRTASHPQDDHYLLREEAALKVAQWTHGTHVIGAVPSFDTITLDPMLRNVGYLPAHHYHLMDVEAMAVGYLAGLGIVLPPPYKSDDLVALLGLPPVIEAERHTALGDSRMALAMYDRVMDQEAGQFERDETHQVAEQFLREKARLARS